MSDRETSGDYNEFKSGFLAEVDEYLQVIEHLALELETDLGSQTPEPRRIKEIFRAAHTIKALSAMLEFEPLVELCHRLESMLRGLERGTVPFTPMVVDLLIQSSKVLSSLVEDVRADRQLRQPRVLLGQLDDLLALSSRAPSPSAEDSSNSPAPASPAPSPGRDRAVYEVRFQPTPELVARGVSINVVREALMRLGELLEVRPEVDPESPSQITFVLRLATTGDASAIIAATGVDAGSVLEVETRVAETTGAEEDTASVESFRQQGLIRVDISKLDDLMRLVGELVISRARIDRAVDELERNGYRDRLADLQEVTQRMERQIRDLREAVMQVRLVEVRQAFGRMHLAVRDAARAARKQVHLVTSGEETEVDKMLVDRLTDPLLHLVRNAVDHGIESPKVRRSRGKPEVGTLTLSARPEGDRVVIEVSDDGQGIDREKVAEKAASLGLDRQEILSDDDALLRALCHSGLSTREQAGRTSGRGVGMDVVWQRVRELNGSLDLSTRPGAGATFTIRLPITLAIVEALTASSGGQRFAIPISAVREVAEVLRRDIVSFEGNEIVQHRGEVLPLLRMDRLFHLCEEHPDRPYLHGLIVDTGGSKWVLTVDRLIGEQEVVVKPLTDFLVRTPGVVGATDLGDGKLVLILDIPELVRAERSRYQSSTIAGGAS